MFQLLLTVIYLAFISLGLPDALLGSAWPTMYREFGVPLCGNLPDASFIWADRKSYQRDSVSVLSAGSPGINGCDVSKTIKKGVPVM